MHLSDHKVKAFLCIRFVIENKLALHVVEFEELDPDCITICYQDVCLPARCLFSLLKILYLGVEILKRIDEGFKFSRSAISHIAK